MQAIHTAFITTNTSYSGIPSAKANSISRTFPNCQRFTRNQKHAISSTSYCGYSLYHNSIHCTVGLL